MELKDRNKSVLYEFVEAVNTQNWEKIDELVADDFIRHSYAAGEPKIASREQLKQFLRREFETFPDAQETIEDIVCEEDKVAVRHRLRGTQLGAMGSFPASGKVLCADYIAIYRLKKGKIIEAWAEWDNLHGLVQLGHYTSPA
ncbi:MAG: ester cyclase [Coleofasciculus sp. S288]|nr:ester cyclase [Coleofasciculus sp. S288]